MYNSICKLINLGKSILNKKVSINGWVKTVRKYKNNLIFVDINDGSCVECIQIIIKKTTYCNFKINNIISGCSINVKGIIVESIGEKEIIEIIAKKVIIFGTIYNSNKYPLSIKNHSFEYLREILHLRSRTYFFGAVSRIRNSLYYKIHQFMNKNNFIWIPTPIITSVDTEGSSKLFNIYSNDDKNNLFFNKNVFLTVSGQLNAEIYACSMSKVYAFGPVFRAENSNTRKHLAEFWMFEPEISFFNIKELIKFSESFIKSIFKFIIKNNLKDIEYINKKLKINTIDLLKKYIDNDFIILDYSEIIKILNNKNINIEWGEDISSNNEKFLLELYNLPIFIINFPKKIKPYYMKINNDNKSVSSMDLIFPNIGEIIGGSEREYRLNILKKSMNNNINNWYLDLRKYGTVPHSGFGMGLERLILLITGINNIRDASAFPRFPGNVNC